jgi:stage V sporulation protein AD
MKGNMDKMSQAIGQQSIRFERAAYIQSSASIVGTKEGEGPLGNYFDVVGSDDKFGEENWEASESTLQKEAATLAIGKCKLQNSDIRFVFGGDLLGQTIATTFGLMELNIPLFGLYGACSTAGESLALASMAVSAGYCDNALAISSSHFASAEKQFRFPLRYASQRPLSATWTVTGSGAYVVGTKPSRVRVSGVTVGKVIDYGIKDTMNMGAAMAPAACDTIFLHLQDFGRKPEDYDKIITGDLGYVGQTILLELLKAKGCDILSQHMDCGIEIFDSTKQDTHSGGSGCGCSAVTLSAYIMPQLETGQLKRILFVPTGALLSTVTFNEGMTVPSIAHAVVIEHVSEKE